MTDDPSIWLIATLEVAGAIGIAGFWITWVREPHSEPWLPVGYESHERAFLLPDGVLATLLVVSAVLLLLDVPVGRSVALVTSGMLLFLGLIDAAYFAHHGMFDRQHGGLLNAAIVGAVLILAAVLMLRFGTI